MNETIMYLVVGETNGLNSIKAGIQAISESMDASIISVRNLINSTTIDWK